MVALIITLSLTSIAGAAQAAIVNALGLGSIEWLRPAMTLIALSISIAANYLLFYGYSGYYREISRRKALLRGALIAAIGFEVIKFIMTMMLPRLASSPSGAAFGSVIGLMAFFYFCPPNLILCGLIATAHDVADNRVESKDIIEDKDIEDKNIEDQNVEDKSLPTRGEK